MAGSADIVVFSNRFHPCTY
uniref:Uncharacterized protein n=1 Tax=Arundo donax TaxID=35708 RepID=A0A0A9TD88_ARUDO